LLTSLHLPDDRRKCFLPFKPLYQTKHKIKTILAALAGLLSCATPLYATQAPDQVSSNTEDVFWEPDDIDFILVLQNSKTHDRILVYDKKKDVMQTYPHRIYSNTKPQKTAIYISAKKVMGTDSKYPCYTCYFGNDEEYQFVYTKNKQTGGYTISVREEDEEVVNPNTWFRFKQINPKYEEEEGLKCSFYPERIGVPMVVLTDMMGEIIPIQSFLPNKRLTSPSPIVGTGFLAFTGKQINLSREIGRGDPKVERTKKANELQQKDLKDFVTWQQTGKCDNKELNVMLQYTSNNLNRSPFKPEMVAKRKKQEGRYIRLQDGYYGFVLKNDKQSDVILVSHKKTGKLSMVKYGLQEKTAPKGNYICFVIKKGTKQNSFRIVQMDDDFVCKHDTRQLAMEEDDDVSDDKDDAYQFKFKALSDNTSDNNVNLSLYGGKFAHYRFQGVLTDLAGNRLTILDPLYNRPDNGIILYRVGKKRPVSIQFKRNDDTGIKSLTSRNS
jgi:hypothetical protein